MRYYETASEAINDLAKRGYTTDFKVLTDKECLLCHQTSKELSPKDFEIDEIYRFDGETDPGDEMIVHAISSTKHNLKGIIINGYGTYADTATYKIVSQLRKRVN